MSERFWSKVDRSGGPDACWLWTAARHADGYGGFSMQRPDGSCVMVPAHRAALLISGVTPLRADLDACHRPTCPRHCVNPAHLRFDTHAANMAERNAMTGATKNRLSAADKTAVCRKYIAGVPVTVITREYGVTRQNIHYLLKRRGLVTRPSHGAANNNGGVQTGEIVDENVRDVG